MEYITPLNEHSPLDLTNRIRRKEVGKIKTLFRSLEALVRVRPCNLWLGTKIRYQREMEARVIQSDLLLKTPGFVHFNADMTPSKWILKTTTESRRWKGKRMVTASRIHSRGSGTVEIFFWVTPAVIVTV